MKADIPSREASAGKKTALRAMTALATFVAILGALFVFAPEDFPLYVKAFHVVAVISWMAGLLYLPRLFIYHSTAPAGSAQAETFKLMEQRLYRVIMNPAMMVTWALGLYLAWSVYGFQGGWLHAKITLVLILTGVHVVFGRAVRALAQDGLPRSQRYWRLMNEVPTLLMIAIVILVVVKPF